MGSIIIGTENITFREYNSKGKYTSGTIHVRFGSWNSALEEAGLIIKNHKNISTEALFENIEQVWLKLGKQPTIRDMKFPLSKYTASAYLTNFGTWQKALLQFVEAINSEEVITKHTTASQGTEKTITSKSENILRHKTKRDPNWRLRFLVMRRDNFKCAACGRTPAFNPNIILHIDHIIAWEKGGETVFENLQTLCSICNIGKSNLDFIEP